MSDDDFPYVSVPEHLQPLLGEPDAGTRIWRAFGSREAFGLWNEALFQVLNEAGVSPGGASMYADVSRAAVYKRMQEGRLTAFLFHPVEGIGRFSKREVLASGGRPYVYLPTSEIIAWGERIKKLPRRDRIRERTEGTLAEGFLVAKGRKVPLSEAKAWLKNARNRNESS